MTTRCPLNIFIDFGQPSSENVEPVFAPSAVVHELSCPTFNAIITDSSPAPSEAALLCAGTGGHLSQCHCSARDLLFWDRIVEEEKHISLHPSESLAETPAVNRWAREKRKSVNMSASCMGGGNQGKMTNSLMCFWMQTSVPS